MMPAMPPLTILGRRAKFCWAGTGVAGCAGWMLAWLEAMLSLLEARPSRVVNQSAARPPLSALLYTTGRCTAVLPDRFLCPTLTMLQVRYAVKVDVDVSE